MQQQTIYLGIDWHKRTSAWVALNYERKVMWEHKHVPCTPAGIEEAFASLTQGKPLDIQAALEPVCGWRWASDFCESLGMKMHIVNPLKMRHIAESSTKTDRADALAIADMLRANILPTAYKCSDELQKLRDIVRVRAYFVHMSTGLKCRLHALCTQEGLHITTEHPWRSDGRDILLNQANPVMLSMLCQLDHLSVVIKKLEKEIGKVSHDNSHINLLQSIPGVGIISAMNIYAEVGDFSRFKSPEALVNYAGLHPRERSSGGRQCFGRITKEGSSLLRYTLVECAMRVRNTEGSHKLYGFYDNLKTKGKKPMVARVALARKILVIMWYMIKQQTPYMDTHITPAQRRDDLAQVT